MTALNPNNYTLDNNVVFSGVATKLGHRLYAMIYRGSSEDLRSLATMETVTSKGNVTVHRTLSPEDSVFVISEMNAWLQVSSDKATISISQKSLMQMTLPSDIDSVLKVVMEVKTDSTSTGNTTRIQLRSFKSIVEYLGVNKPSDGLITISL